MSLLIMLGLGIFMGGVDILAHKDEYSFFSQGRVGLICGSILAWIMLHWWHLSLALIGVILVGPIAFVWSKALG